MTGSSKMSVPIIRLGHPMAFMAFLRHIGAPYQKHLRRLGLPELCDDPDAFLPLRQAWDFFDATARGVDPMLGWRVGASSGDHSLGRTFRRVVENTPTLYQGLKQFVRARSAEASHLQLGILERGDDIVLFTHYPSLLAMTGYSCSQAYQIGVIVGVIRHFAGENWIPEEIGIESPIVPTIAEELYPGSRILARQRVGYVAIPRSVLHLAPLRLVSERDEEASLFLTKDFDYVHTLRVLLKPHLSEGYLAASLAASLMDASERTFYRRLSKLNLSYHAVIDGLRFDEARKLLQTTDEPIIDVAAAVGFEDPANFTRMFRRIGAVSPREYRRMRCWTAGGSTSSSPEMNSTGQP